MIALIHQKNIVENNLTARAIRYKMLLMFLLLGLMFPTTLQAQDVGNPSKALDGCKKPTQLTVSQITTNSAQLSWIENGEATA